MVLSTASAQRIHPSALCTARVVIQDIMYIIEFFVLPSCSHDLILGWDFLSRHEAVIDCSRAEVSLVPTCEFSSPDRSLLPCKLIVDADTTLPPEASVPITLSCTGQPDATVVFTPSPLFTERKGIVLPFAVLTIASGSTIMLITNHCNYPVALLRGESLRSAQPVDHI